LRPVGNKKINIYFEASYKTNYIMGLFSRKKKQEPVNSSNSTDSSPGEEFAILEAEFDDLPWFASINMAYKNYNNKTSAIWHLHIEIDMQDVTDAGLPTDKEAAILNPFEGELLQKIDAVVSNHYIGRVTYNGTRELFIYLDDPESANNLLQELVNTPPYVRQFGYSMVEDPEWEEINVFFQ
jgi:Family of unknown function (DUF695)